MWRCTVAEQRVALTAATTSEETGIAVVVGVARAAAAAEAGAGAGAGAAAKAPGAALAGREPQAEAGAELRPGRRGVQADGSAEAPARAGAAAVIAAAGGKPAKARTRALRDAKVAKVGVGAEAAGVKVEQPVPDSRWTPEVAGDQVEGMAKPCRSWGLPGLQLLRGSVAHGGV